NLPLLDKENEKLLIIKKSTIEEEINYNLCPAGTFLEEQMVNPKAMKKTLLSKWCLIEEISRFSITTSILFNFIISLFLRRSWSGPWSFDNCLLLVHQLKQCENLFHVDVHYDDFWVQVRQLSLGFDIVSLAKNLGNLMEQFLEYDGAKKRNQWDKYICDLE
ncbi:hypothetical protein Golob_012122, partial [Gossypium lobatum]|nr:hypothetical protein [Gossypium lobatum]